MSDSRTGHDQHSDKPARGRLRWGPWWRALASLLSVLTIYYAFPLRWTGAGLVASLLFTFAGAGALAWAIAGQLRRHLREGASIELPTLTTLMSLVLAVFAFGYFSLETAVPGEMANLATRTDALYFTMQVLTTVGLGDVYAVGQTGRALVTLQMVFDVVFIAAGGSVLVASVRDSLRDGRERA